MEIFFPLSFNHHIYDPKWRILGFMLNNLLISIQIEQFFPDNEDEIEISLNGSSITDTFFYLLVEFTRNNLTRLITTYILNTISVTIIIWCYRTRT
jgi:hypothetical protein